MQVIDSWKLMPKQSTPVNKLNQSQNGDVVSDFSKMFNNSLQKVNNLQIDAENKEQQFVSGEIENVHDVMIAAEKSKLALELTVELKNKLLEAYKTIERMPV